MPSALADVPTTPVPTSTPVVAGIDLSLTSTGVAVVHSRERVMTHRVTSSPPRQETLRTRLERMQAVSDQILDLVRPARLVAIEAPAYAAAARSGKLHDRSGMWWHVVAALIADGKDVIEVAPSSRARYATGKGNAGKDLVLATVVRVYRHVNVSGNDEADALVLAAMLARLTGQPIETGTPGEMKLKALEKIRLPLSA